MNNYALLLLLVLTACEGATPEVQVEPDAGSLEDTGLGDTFATDAWVGADVGDDVTDDAATIVDAGDAGATDSGDAAPDVAVVVDAGPPEVCNGSDDDSDDSIDEGCPIGLVVAGSAGEREAFGPWTGAPFMTCAEADGSSAVVTRMAVHANGAGVDCSPLSLLTDAEDVPFSYGVVRGPERWGGNINTDTELIGTSSCPPGSIATGMHVYLGAPEVETAALVCQSVEIDASTLPARLVWGAPDVTEIPGGVPATTPTVIQCPRGSAITMTSVAVNPRVFTGLGIECTNISIDTL